MGSITNRVTGELLHHVRTRRTLNSVQTVYRRQPFRAVRPADGQPPAAGEAVCDTCGEAVPYRIMSRRSTVLRRRFWLVLLLVAVALILASCGGMTIWDIEWFDGWQVVVGTAGWGLAIGAFGGWASVDGVRVGRPRGAHRHVVRSGFMNTEGYGYQQR